MFQFKTQIAEDGSREAIAAIVNICNAETGHFRPEKTIYDLFRGSFSIRRYTEKGIKAI